MASATRSKLTFNATNAKPIYELGRKDVLLIVQAMAGFDPLPVGLSKLPDDNKTIAVLQLFSPPT